MMMMCERVNSSDSDSDGKDGKVARSVTLVSNNITLNANDDTSVRFGSGSLSVLLRIGERGTEGPHHVSHCQQSHDYKTKKLLVLVPTKLLNDTTQQTRHQPSTMKNLLILLQLAFLTFWCSLATAFVPHALVPMPSKLLLLSKTKLLAELPRRDFQTCLFSGFVGGNALSGRSNKANAAIETAAATGVVAVTTTRQPPLADIKMVRLKLPRGGFGREYVALKLKVNDSGPYDFMVDSGLTLEMISPHLQNILGLQDGKNRMSGLAAGGSTVSNALVPLTGAAIAGEGGGEDLPLPQLTAAVTPFPQEHIDPAHDPVEGMLGMEVVRTVQYGNMYTSISRKCLLSTQRTNSSLVVLLLLFLDSYKCST